ncbi:Non-catalytic module family expansin [Trichoderma austrokoningii]
MVAFSTTVISALFLALTTSAAPAAASNTGDMTWYEVGLGACGQTNYDNQLVAAVSHSLYDSEHPCGRNIRIQNGDKSVVVKVVDRCGGCAENDLDLSQSAFEEVIGPLGIGRAPASWEWAN